MFQDFRNGCVRHVSCRLGRPSTIYLVQLFRSTGLPVPTSNMASCDRISPHWPGLELVVRHILPVLVHEHAGEGPSQVPPPGGPAVVPHVCLQHRFGKSTRYLFTVLLFLPQPYTSYICPDSALPLQLSRFLEMRKITPALQPVHLIRKGLFCGVGMVGCYGWLV